MKKKLSLNELKIKSFITSLEEKVDVTYKIKGGVSFGFHSGCTDCTKVAYPTQQKPFCPR